MRKEIRTLRDTQNHLDRHDPELAERFRDQLNVASSRRCLLYAYLRMFLMFAIPSLAVVIGISGVVYAAVNFNFLGSMLILILMVLVTAAIMMLSYSSDAAQEIVREAAEN